MSYCNIAVYRAAVKGWCSILCSCCITPRARGEEKGQREGSLPCVVCCSSLSLPTTQVSHPTRLNHTVTHETHLCASARKHIPQGMTHTYPLISPGSSDSRWEEKRKKRTDENTVKWNPDSEQHWVLWWWAVWPSVLWGGSRHSVHQNFCWTWASWCTVPVLVTTATAQRSSIERYSLRAFIIVLANTCFNPFMCLIVTLSLLLQK